MLRPGVRRLFSLKSTSRSKVERDVEEELQTHVQFRVAQLVARGWTLEAAEREARARFGEFAEASAVLKHSALQRERRMNWRMWADAFHQDARLSLRALARNPGFALAVALTLALGIGANAAMFGIVDRLLLRAPEHVYHADRIVEFGARMVVGSNIATQPTFPYHTYREFRNGLSGMAKVGMSTNPVTMPLGRGTDARLVTGVLTNADFFSLIGVKPQRGRFFAADEVREPVGEAVAVISYGLWQRDFAGDDNAIGTKIDLGGDSFTIVGIAPRGFTGFELAPVDLWIPITGAGRLNWYRGADWLTTKASTWIRVYARLNDGVSPEQLAAMATPINDSEGEPRLLKLRSSMVAVPLLQSLRSSRGPVAKVATLLAGLSLIVVLIACTNVVNLVLSRAASRKQEVAIRLALGVTKMRLAVQLLCETVLLALLGGVGACGIAFAGGTIARALIFGEGQWAGAPMDARIVAYIGMMSAAAALVAGIVPLVQSRSLTLTSSLKSGARDGRRSAHVARSAILVGQSALSVLLLVATGLFVRSLQAVYNVPLGMHANRVVLGRMNVSLTNSTPERTHELFKSMAERLRASGSIQSAAVATTVAGHNSVGALLFVPGMDSLPRPNGGGPYLTGVEPGFFATMGTRLIAGRDFSEADNATSMRVAIINETMARLLWPTQSALGQCIQLKEKTADCTIVVGVSENSRRQNWIEEEIFQVAQPLAQSTSRSRILLVRPEGEVNGAALSVVRQAMQSASPDLPFADVRPLVRLYDAELRPWKLGAGLLGAFAVLALFLVAVGMFATLSFAVSQRTHEIGVRMALGARSAQVVQLVVRDGLALVAVGAVIGAALSLSGGQIIQNLLFQVSARDSAVLAASILLLAMVAFAATAIPALRASRTNPVTALHAE